MTVHNADSIFARKNDMKAGDEYPVRVRRGDEEIDFTGRLVQSFDHHVFEQIDDATEAQLRLRRIWTTNRD